MKKNASPQLENRHSITHAHSTRKIAIPFDEKLPNVVFYLLAGGTLNRFEAERIGDHCLNSTISVIRNVLGLPIGDRWESVPNRFGTMTLVKRYWLMPEGFRRATHYLRGKYPGFFRLWQGGENAAD